MELLVLCNALNVIKMNRNIYLYSGWIILFLGIAMIAYSDTNEWLFVLGFAFGLSGGKLINKYNGKN